MFVVFGASGNTGSVVATTLLGGKQPVRVVVRSTAAGDAWRARGAEVAVADLEDRGALERVLQGAAGAYVLLPPAFQSTQVRIDNDRRAKTVAAAVAASGVAHVVMLSSIGAQQADGTGPILSVHDAEATLAGRAPSTTFLRAAYFMENWAAALAGLEQGVLPSFLLADRAIPMVATRDIGLTAARLLVEGGAGARVVQLAGPRDYSPRDIASALGRVTGKAIAVQQHPDEAMSAAMLAAGMNAEWARLFQELAHGINIGRVTWEAGRAVQRGDTDIEAALAPLLVRA